MLAASHAPTSSNSGISRVRLCSHRPVEAAQLALQIAGRLAEPLQADLGEVDRVQLDERVDQFVGDPPALLGVVQRRRDRVGDHLAVHLLHHVERRADHARRPRTPPARGGCAPAVGSRAPQQAGLAQHVVGAGRQRARAEAGAARRRSTGHRSRSSARRRPGWRSGPRAPRGRRRPGTRAADRARAAARGRSPPPCAWVSTMSSGAIAAGIRRVSLPARICASGSRGAGAQRGCGLRRQARPVRSPPPLRRASRPADQAAAARGKLAVKPPARAVASARRPGRAPSRRS